MTIDIPTSTINHSLSLVARYSDDAVNGEGQHVDYWFGPLKMDDSNQGYLDSIESDGKTVTVSGWHATNQAANRPYHYIIAFDQTLGHEIARQKVESVQRPDVAKVHRCYRRGCCTDVRGLGRGRHGLQLRLGPRAGG